MGNGAKAAQKRERAKGKESKPRPKSKPGSNLTIVCGICKHSFMNTTRAPDLVQHATDKHNKTMQECFPTFTL